MYKRPGIASVLYKKSSDSLLGKVMMNLFKYLQHNKDTATASTTIPVVGRETNWFKYLQFNKDVDTAQDTRTILLTIFTLIASTTFQAGLNPPDCFWQDLPKTEPRVGNYAEENVASSAIFSSRKILYYVFLLSNTFAFYNSILVILFLTHKFPFKFEIRVATLSMAITYGSAVFSVTRQVSFKFRFVLVVSFLPFVIRFLIYVCYWYSKKSPSGGKVVTHTSNSIDVKIPSGIASGVRSSPVNYRRSVNPEIV